MSDSSRCPSPEEIAAFVAGSLSGDELTKMTEHILRCEDCRTTVAAAALIDRQAEFADTAPASRRVTPWWLAAAAAVLLGTTALLTLWFVRNDNEAIHQLVEAAPRDGRYLEPRLSGGFAWAPILPIQRDSSQPLDPRAMKLVGAAGEVLEKTANDASTEAQHAAALAHLLAGRPNAAAALLEPLANGSTDATIWSDLAAARYAAAIHGGQAQQFGQALAAADMALRLNPRLTEALFNRALTVERLGLRDRAADAWRQYLAADAESAWAGEARKHLARLSGTSSFQREFDRDYVRLSADATLARSLARRYPQEARSWGETEILGRWAEALHKKRNADAMRHLTVARIFGESVAKDGGDRMLQDAVAAIDAGSPDTKRLLAEAHLRFRDAQRLFRTGRPEAALPEFQSATDGFTRGRSPIALLARYYAANTFYERGDIAQSRQQIQALLTSAPSRYQSHRAQLEWQMGLLEAATGQWGPATTVFDEAVRRFEALGERRNSAIVRHILAEVYDRIGDSRSAWAHRVIAWQELGRTEDKRLQSALQTGARAAALEGDWQASESFLDLAINMPRADGTDLLRFETLLFRARVLGRLGRGDAAATDLDRAAAVMARIADPATRERAEADQLAITGFLALSPRVAVASLTRAIDFHGAKGRRMFLPELHLERGRAHAKLRDFRAAANDFESGIRELEIQRLSLRAGDERWGMFSSYSELFDEALALALSQRDAERAFAYAERARARELLDSLDTVNSVVAYPGSSRSQPPRDAVLIEYATLPTSLVMFVVDAQQLRVIQTAVPRSVLTRDAEALLDSAMEGDQTRFRGAASALYDRLLAPAGNLLREHQRLIVVPDAALSAIPFAALIAPDGKHLIERYSITIAPSAAVSARLESRRRRVSHQPHLLLISGPAGSEGDIRQLTNAQREADAVTAIYHHDPDVVSDDQNTATFEQRAANADVIHFVGHARLPEAGAAGALVTAHTGSIDVRGISSLRLRRTRTVILAACGTARGEHRAGQESISVARAFLVAGAPSVVATLWPIDDGAAAEFFPRLHRHLADGVAPADAVRATQLESIRRGDAPPGLWAAVQIIGS